MPSRTVSWEELSRHSQPGDLWIAVAGVAYDVSDFGDDHPGGKMVFERSGGRDVTEPFQAYHPDWVAKTMKRFEVGRMESSRRGTLPGPTVMYTKLFAEIKSAGLLETDYGFYVRTGAWLSFLFALAWGLVLSGRWVLGAVTIGIFWQQASFVGHDAGHNSITHNRKTDGNIALVVNAFIGVGMSWWKSSHNIHHILVNSTDCDPDIQHLPLLAPSHNYLQTTHSEYHDFDLVFDGPAKYLVPYQHLTFFPLLLVAKFGMYIHAIRHFMTGGTVFIHKIKEYFVMIFFMCWYLSLAMLVPTWPERVMFVMLSHSIVSILHLQVGLCCLYSEQEIRAILWAFPVLWSETCPIFHPSYVCLSWALPRPTRPLVSNTLGH
ncbi:unnamed protein product [Ostreobium quekettii]|uniref:Cytochrome b5 heme-binding domain-containing protein n=1 Tax=Ostreobium quekettii TaxID=121088 RepID=A0A8S1IXR7_9CHLO|nr:unnamed protein product [Ostreobium quekettii]